jgi:amidase
MEFLHMDVTLNGRTMRLEYLSVDELSQQMACSQLSSVDLVRYLQLRIEALNKKGPELNAILELNPDALAIAEALDQERQQGRTRGPLHGIPVLLKDNIDTGDRMQTSAGSLAMVGQPATQDAFIVQRLRAAGAIILGKTNLSEWANFRDREIPNSWSGRGGLSKNPHVLSESPYGSSSGSAVAVAAGLAPLAVGTETVGSIIAPASVNGVVGFKPTAGLLSRTGIIPITPMIDTPGPMARTVREAALLLNAMTGQDDTDPVRQPRAVPGFDFTQRLRPNALVGKRIGYPARFFTTREAALEAPEFSRALEVMQAAGASLCPVQLIDPHSDRLEEGLLLGLKRHLSAYLTTRSGIPVQNLDDLVQFNQRSPGAEGYGQALLIKASQIDFDEQTYNEVWQQIKTENAAAINDALVAQGLDAMVMDVGSPGLNVTPLAGYPSVMVPSGIGDDGVPTSVFFFGTRWSDANLLALAYAYEQAADARRIPEFKP